MQGSFIKGILVKGIVTLAASLALASATAQTNSHPAFKVDVSGKGAPIILIPGLASAGEVWDGTVAHYCGGHQCHVLTLAGFAGQPAIEGPLLSAVEQQLSEYISVNKLAHAVVIGHSLGGFVGLKLAADHPDQVSRLVIVDSLPALGAMQMPSITPAQLKEVGTGMRENMMKASPEAFAASLKQNTNGMVSKPEHRERVLAAGLRSDQPSVAKAMYELMTEDMRDKIASIKAPTLVLGTWIAYKDYTTRDAVVGVFRTQYAKLPGVKIEITDTARHFIMYDDPDWMYARIDDFLK